jgi:hypothetical protein
MLQWIHANVFGWWTDGPARLELALEFYRPVGALVSSHAIFRVSWRIVSSQMKIDKRRD